MFTKDSNEINFNMRRRYRQAFNKQTQREGYAIKNNLFAFAIYLLLTNDLTAKLHYLLFN